MVGVRRTESFLESPMAQSLWSDRPLGMKLGAIVAVGAVSLGAFALIAVQALNGTGQRTDELLKTTRATSQAMEADMMHDAVRADVLQALVNSSGSLYQASVTDVADHSARFRDILAGVTDAHLGTSVDGAVEAVTPLVEQYLTSASTAPSTEVPRWASVTPARMSRNLAEWSATSVTEAW